MFSVLVYLCTNQLIKSTPPPSWQISSMFIYFIRTLPLDYQKSV